MSDAESNAEVRLKEPKKGKLIKEAEEYKQALDKRGVIYISRVPPFMKPNKVRNMFEQYGEVTRLYLAEEGKKRTVLLSDSLSLPVPNVFHRYFAAPEAEGERWKRVEAVQRRLD